MRALKVVLIAALLQFAGGPLIGAGGAAADDSWLFILYMSADEPGSPLNWSADINELESGLHGQNMTAIAMVDPPGIGDTVVYRIVHDPNDSGAIVSQVLAYAPLGAGGEANMGEAQTFVDFLGFAIDGYYAGGRVAVIPWGHGNGWMGVCQDKGDYLEPKELATGLESAVDLLGRSVDLLIFDACSMSSLETLSLLPGLAEYSVSSEIQVPDFGFPYGTVLEDISDEPAMSTLDAAKVFVDDYVQFSALVAGITSQAAAIDVHALGDAMAEFGRYREEATLFVPVARSTLLGVRNSSYEIGGAASIDLMHYLKTLADQQGFPKRLSRAGLDLWDSLRNCTSTSRVYIAPVDTDVLTPDSFQGLSVFFPGAAAPMGSYANTSGLAADWSVFLGLLMSNSSYAAPDSGISLHLSDHRYGDGLADSVSFTWDATPEVDEWSCDALVHGGWEMEGRLNFSDSANGSGILDSLVPGYYDVCIYGRDVGGSYRYYGIHENVEIMRRYAFEAHLSAFVAAGTLEILNLETGDNSSIEVSGDSANLSFIVPSPFSEGDRVLLSLVSDGETIARGLVVLSGDITDVYLEEVAQPTSLASMLIFLLAAGLIIFAFVKLKAVDRSALSRVSKKLRRR